MRINKTKKEPMTDHQKHSLFMQQALRQARRAYALDEVPVGAVVVDASGTIIARAYNQAERRHTQTAHAELQALAKAGKKTGDWRLQGCWIYVTLEPCAMCYHAILLSRLQGLVYGAASPLFGYRLDKAGTVSLYKDKSLAIQIVNEIEAQESIDLLQSE